MFCGVHLVLCLCLFAVCVIIASLLRLAASGCLVDGWVTRNLLREVSDGQTLLMSAKTRCRSPDLALLQIDAEKEDNSLLQPPTSTKNGDSSEMSV